MRSADDRGVGLDECDNLSGCFTARLVGAYLFAIGLFTGTFDVPNLGPAKKAVKAKNYKYSRIRGNNHGMSRKERP
jgi:hypothetical protein